jgi:hypothetical protein
VAATQVVEEVAESHQARVAAVVRHHAAVDPVKADLVVGQFVSQMLAVVHLLLKDSVENKLKVAKRFVSC